MKVYAIKCTKAVPDSMICWTKGTWVGNYFHMGNPVQRFEDAEIFTTLSRAKSRIATLEKLEGFKFKLVTFVPEKK